MHNDEVIGGIISARNFAGAFFNWFQDTNGLSTLTQAEW